MYEPKNLGRPEFLSRADVQIEFESRPNAVEAHMHKQMRAWSKEASRSAYVLSENSARAKFGG